MEATLQLPWNVSNTRLLTSCINLRLLHSLTLLCRSATSVHEFVQLPEVKVSSISAGRSNQTGQGHGANGDRDGDRGRAGPGDRAPVAHPARRRLLPPPLQLPPPPSASLCQAAQGAMV